MKRTSDNSKRKYFTMWDLLPLAVILFAFALGICLWLGAKTDDNLTAVVAVRGEVCYEISLSEVSKPYELTVQGEQSVVLSVSSEGVCFKSSECPDKLCVNTGHLTHSGESAVCLPARVSVKLVADKNTDINAPDAVAG